MKANQTMIRSAVFFAAVALAASSQALELTAPKNVPEGQLAVVDCDNADAQFDVLGSATGGGLRLIPFEERKAGGVVFVGPRGSYVIFATAIEDGRLAKKAVELTIGPAPKPDNPDNPDDPNPPAPGELQKKVADWAKAFPADQRATYAKAWTIVADDGQAGKHATGAAMAAAVANLVVDPESPAYLGVNEYLAWRPFREQLAQELTRLRNAGSLPDVAAHVKAWREIAAGLTQ